jgi:hypothetical protein
MDLKKSFKQLFGNKLLFPLPLLLLLTSIVTNLNFIYIKNRKNPTAATTAAAIVGLIEKDNETMME